MFIKSNLTVALDAKNEKEWCILFTGLSSLKHNTPLKNLFVGDIEFPLALREDVLIGIITIKIPYSVSCKFCPLSKRVARSQAFFKSYPVSSESLVLAFSFYSFNPAFLVCSFLKFE
jgi:hypothetical protein